MKNIKIISAIIVQFLITIYLHGKPIDWILFFFTIFFYIYVTKILDSSHKIYKLCTLSLYASLYSGIVVQIMSYLENIMQKIPYVISIPAFIGVIIIFILCIKEILKVMCSGTKRL